MVELIKPYYINKNSRILFSAHGLPKSIIEQGDPYQWQIEQPVEKIVEELNIPNLDYKITYQSRVGPKKWLTPPTANATYNR
jgi:ferrochelatase